MLLTASSNRSLVWITPHVLPIEEGKTHRGSPFSITGLSSERPIHQKTEIFDGPGDDSLVAFPFGLPLDVRSSVHDHFVSNSLHQISTCGLAVTILA